MAVDEWIFLQAAPIVTAINAVPSSPGSLAAGERVTFTLDIDTAVQVFGDPMLLLSNRGGRDLRCGGVGRHQPRLRLHRGGRAGYGGPPGQQPCPERCRHHRPGGLRFRDERGNITRKGYRHRRGHQRPGGDGRAGKRHGRLRVDAITNTAEVSGTGDAGAVVTLTETGLSCSAPRPRMPLVPGASHPRLRTERTPSPPARRMPPAIRRRPRSPSHSTPPAHAHGERSIRDGGDFGRRLAGQLRRARERCDRWNRSGDLHRERHAGDPGITLFSVGSHAVLASATDLAGNTASTSFSFDVKDTTAPVVAASAPARTEATSAAGASVTLAASAIDAVNGAVPVTLSENNVSVASGDTFAIGQHTIVASATDATANTRTVSFSFDVVDTTAPVVTASAPASTEATSATGASVAFIASSTDVVDRSDTVTFSENGTSVKSGDTFAVGLHTIVASAKDAANNTGTTQFSFDVVDTTAPVVTASAPATTEATSASGASVTFTYSATDVVDEMIR